MPVIVVRENNVWEVIPIIYNLFLLLPGIYYNEIGIDWNRSNAGNRIISITIINRIILIVLLNRHDNYRLN